jgi:hypothetical protein
LEVALPPHGLALVRRRRVAHPNIETRYTFYFILKQGKRFIIPSIKKNIVPQIISEKPSESHHNLVIRHPKYNHAHAIEKKT